ncbi:MAG TPA: ribonuclease HI family protein [bacterium]|nr:ribonuclease HI family protein [bacterium]
MKRLLHVDGASRGNPGPAAIGIVVADSRGKVLEEIGEVIGEATNNVAEYRALIRALEAVQAQGATEVEIRTDSELLVRQVQGTFKVKAPGLRALHESAMRLLDKFSTWTIHHVPREANARADQLANRALDALHPPGWLEFSVLLQDRPGRVRAVVPALPGIEATAPSRTEALERVKARVETYLRSLRDRGDPLPREERIRIRLDGSPQGPKAS